MGVTGTRRTGNKRTTTIVSIAELPRGAFRAKSLEPVGLRRANPKKETASAAVRWLVMLCLGAVLFRGFPMGHAAAAPFDWAALQHLLREKITALQPAGTTVGQNGRRDLFLQLQEVYTTRDFRPLWTDGWERSPRVEEFLKVLGEKADEGLQPSVYGLERLQAAWSKPPVTIEEVADREIFTSQMFLKLASHLAWGRFDPEREFFQWIPYRRPADTVAALREAGVGSVAKTLDSVTPRHPSYLLLKEELKRYRIIASSTLWVSIPPKVVLRYGVVGPYVEILKEKLILFGDLRREFIGDPRRFDAALDLALRRFQWRHGLPMTGVVDRGTRAALNMPLSERIRRMEINLERWRWYPDDFGSRYVMVILPDFWLFVVDEGRTILSMKTVVGTAKQPSPVFNGDMTYVEINPTWNIPNSIVEKEMIPKVLKDPDFLKKKKIRIYRDWSDRAKEIDPQSIDWKKINPERFPYRMVQDPHVNPLGRIKFMFPNEFDVYLHDTTQRHLFQRQRRMFSHGCIRIEKPFDLGEWVLRDNPGWTKERILKEIGTGKRQVVTLARSVPVHILYLTAWMDGNGILQFREDIYGYDVEHEKVLQKHLNHRSSGM